MKVATVRAGVFAVVLTIGLGVAAPAQATPAPEHDSLEALAVVGEERMEEYRDSLAAAQGRTSAARAELQRLEVTIDALQVRVGDPLSAIERRLDETTPTAGSLIRAVHDLTGDADLLRRAYVSRDDLLGSIETYLRAEKDLEARLTDLRAQREAIELRLRAARAAARRAAIDERGRFPVDGPCEYVDSWGFARSGGRGHEGTDIMAASGTPVLAVRGGTVRADRNRLGGLTLWQEADDGTRYYYAHLRAVEIPSGPVEAGDVIGYVGSSGNAGAPHLHFEVHQPGRGAVNPYPLLERMVR